MSEHPGIAMKFEKQPKRVVYVPEENIYRATLSAVTSDKRPPRDSRKHLVSVAAAVTYWDNVDKRAHCLGCANTVKAAWTSGDRYLLDTDNARRAAELVADLADTKPDENDICSALSDLLNAIAEVRLSNTTFEDFEVLPACSAAIEKCLALPGYASWSVQSRHRRFLYALDRKYRTPVVATLMGLYFQHGSTPVLTSKQRQELLALDRGEGASGAVTFFDNCLRQITAYRFS